MSSKFKIYMADLVHNRTTQGNYVVPLNIAAIAAYLKEGLKIGAEFKLFKYPSDLLDALDREAPDILALSNYLWNSDLNYQLGMYVRKNYPGVVISMGGPSIRTDRTGIGKFLEKNFFADAYMLFEGEKPFVNLIERVMNNRAHLKDGRDIEGCAYLVGKELIYKPSAPIRDLAACPSPYLLGYMEEFLHKGFIPLFETSRGCPFQCTFCTWGISASHKIRAFPIERVFAELELVAKNFPENPVWMFADANFGIFDRDIQIAEKIREIKNRTPQLKRVVLWQTKNKTEQNLKIAETIGELEKYLIAVQTFDQKVQELIKRKNIRCDDALPVVRKLQNSGIKTQTDIIYGLPGETKESHLNTLRKCFDIGFDFINCTNAIMLPGSELETEESRCKFNIKTKYRLRQGSYGEYKEIKAIEYEEIVRSTASMKESEMLQIRLIHWLLWYGWNAGYLKGIMKYLHREHKINPVDLIIHIISSKDKFLNQFFGGFIKEAKAEWFESEEVLRKHYNKKENWDNLLEDHFRKMVFKYTTILILDREKFAKFLDSISNVIAETVSSEILTDAIHVLKNITVDTDAIIAEDVAGQKKFRVRKECLNMLLEDELKASAPDGGPDYCDIILEISPEDIVTIRNLLQKHGFDQNKNIAVEKILEIFLDIFSYKIKTAVK